MLFNQLVRQYTNEYNQVWNNSAATPDLIVTAMGTNAQTVFALSAGLAAYLTQAGATVPTTMPSTWNYTANPDGSVTLTPNSTSGS